MAEDARDDLKAKANKANWAGVNATVSREFISKTAGEFSDAVSQATTIRDILRDTRNELIQYRDDLNEAIDRGWDKHLSTYGTQGGGFSILVNVHPEPADSRQAAETLRAELQGILEKATTSDETAAQLLRAIADQETVGFTDVKYKDRDSAAESLQKADALTKLAKRDPDSLSIEEISQFNNTLHKFGQRCQLCTRGHELKEGATKI